MDMSELWAKHYMDYLEQNYLDGEEADKICKQASAYADKKTAESEVVEEENENT